MSDRPERMPIAVRAYTVPAKTRKRHSKYVRSPPNGPSGWTLVFDAETTTDPSQRLRFGSYLALKENSIREPGFFYNPELMSGEDLSLLKSYATENGLRVRTVREFVDKLFFPIVYEARGLCIGFNLPFDLARLAVSQSSARTTMRGGFSLRLSDNKNYPPIRVRHLNKHATIVHFQKLKQWTPRGMRTRGLKAPAPRGYFLD